MSRHLNYAYLNEDGQTGYFVDCPKCHFFKNSPAEVGGPCRNALCDETNAWVKDKHGASFERVAAGWRAGPGFYPTGVWEAMWDARGPLTLCGPYGTDLENSDDQNAREHKERYTS